MLKSFHTVPKFPQILSSDSCKGGNCGHNEELEQLLRNFVLPNKQDFEFGASYGLITTQHYNNFDIRRMAEGQYVKPQVTLIYSTHAKFYSTFNR